MKPTYKKYNNYKQEYNGMTFDSKKELKRWQELELLELAGQITDLNRQITFELLPKQGEMRAVKYIADFMYCENGANFCEDVKGFKGGAAYQVFVIKKKLMMYKHKILVLEV